MGKKNNPDYIIVGGGSAGCVLASRLSEDKDSTVTLIEAGGWDYNPLIHMPAGYYPLMKAGLVNWKYSSTPQRSLDGRRIYCPRGKVIGGSSSINGMVYSRGHYSDYDNWAQLGNDGWSFDECLPYFIKAENFAIPDQPDRGYNGPIRTLRYGIHHPYSIAFVEACRNTGLPYNTDLNVGEQDGVGATDSTMSGTRRCSTAVGYLHPALNRGNLNVVVRAMVSRILLDKDRAVGVEYVRHGKVRRLYCNKEIILSGGAVNSPKILQLSGIGDPDDLRRAGIEVRHELPGVGRNLQDHPAVTVKQLSTEPISLLPYTKPLQSAKAALEYALTGKGPAAYHGGEAQAFLRTRSGLPAPDLQCFMINILYTDSGRKIINQHGFMTYFTLQRPESRGSIKIASADPRAAPLIDLNYFAVQSDLATMREGVKMCREIVAQPAFDRLRGAEYAPGADATSDEQIDQFLRRETFSNFHLSGTCKMGRDSDAVVDNRLRVRGLSGLRVADASIMPVVVSGNINAPTIMIAEKAASLTATE